MSAGDLTLLRLMLQARRFDEQVLRMADRIDGHHHVSHGLEASAAALGLVRHEGDLVATNYRNHAHLICLGHDPALMLAEILGRPVAPQLGRAGSMHLAAPELGVLYTSAMVAGGVPQSLGYALALKRSGAGVSFCLFGDGALEEGVAHESLNLAMLWALPVVFVCENNAGEDSPSLTAVAEAHGVRAAVADGRRPREVVSALRDAAGHTRDTLTPSFLEVRSAEWPGNAAFFPKDVTGPTDLSAAAAQSGSPWYDADDPVLAEARELLAEGVPAERLQAVEAEVTAEIEAAAEHALTAAPASASLAEVAHSDVWAARP
ncbi:MAG: acetoin:2,6-dichlorophenolindophenol oxidoreductase subunit alpha [Thermoleophilaceae bacterium]|jgi:TPP-dependent pyruvate/acetoin dehydrogenase alpha subunit|nr:acetoin:2,6-dichlorophenolindophenol oxidoreductase subunit alpha [Thermoleophilaceae bacterium]